MRDDLTLIIALAVLIIALIVSVPAIVRLLPLRARLFRDMDLDSEYFRLRRDLEVMSERLRAMEREMDRHAASQFLGLSSLRREFDSIAGRRALDLIDRAQDSRKITLTWGARQMLAVPLIELAEYPDDGVEWDQAYDSVRQILDALQETSSLHPFDQRYHSRHIIRGFYKRFCNIPPFCSPRDE